MVGKVVVMFMGNGEVLVVWRREDGGKEDRRTVRKEG